MSEYKIKKEVTEILADYKYNDTKVETTEQYADKIINKCLAEVEKMLEIEKQDNRPEIKEWIRSKEYTEGWNDALNRIKQKLKEIKK